MENFLAFQVCPVLSPSGGFNWFLEASHGPCPVERDKRGRLEAAYRQTLFSRRMAVVPRHSDTYDRYCPGRGPGNGGSLCIPSRDWALCHGRLGHRAIVSCPRDRSCVALECRRSVPWNRFVADGPRARLLAKQHFCLVAHASS